MIGPHLPPQDGIDCYSRLNLLIRRKPKENNFKAVLETIRDLMNTPALNRAIPPWLHDVFLGYGSPKAANHRWGPVHVVHFTPILVV
jgi:intron-binding protein aquarius